MFDIYQVLWNSVVTQKFFIDARVGLNKILFPDLLEGGNNQTSLDTATNIRTATTRRGHRTRRDRYQANATGQYYMDDSAAAAGTSSSSASTTRTR